MMSLESAVLGFVQLGLHRPCFLLPIFGSRRNPEVQQADTEDRIAAFVPCSLTPTTKLVPNTNKTLRKIGDPKLYAFQFTKGPVVKGNAGAIQKALQNRIHSFDEYPYLRSEVDAFLCKADTYTARAGQLFRAKLRATKPMSKSEIVAHLAVKAGTPKKTAATFFDELFKLAVKECKGRAGVFVIPNIARAVKAHRKARMTRNPQTGEPIKIKAKTVVRLRPAKAFKETVLG